MPTVMIITSKALEDVYLSQQESNTFSLSTTAADRRHSTEGTTMSGSGGRGPIGSDHYHPYHQQLSDGAASTSDCLRHPSSSFSCLQDEFHPGTSSHSSRDKASTPWDQYSGSVQVFQLMAALFFPHNFYTAKENKLVLIGEQRLSKMLDISLKSL